MCVNPLVWGVWGDYEADLLLQDIGKGSHGKQDPVGLSSNLL